jgi:hypothetical protein
MRVIRKLNLSTPITILYDEEKETYVIQQGETVPDHVVVADDVLITFHTNVGERRVKEAS